MRYVGLVLILGIALVSCKKKEENPLAKAPGMREIFTAEELTDLNDLLKLFEGEICQTYEGEPTDLRQCYDAFFASLKGAKPGVDYIPISFEEQHRVIGNFHTGSLATFWNNQVVMRKQEVGPKKILSLVYQPNGKLLEFFKMVGKDHVLVEQYAEDFEAIHTISPVMEQEMFRTIGLYDLSDVRVRLVLALHFVTLNDNYKRTHNMEVKIVPVGEE